MTKTQRLEQEARERIASRGEWAEHVARVNDVSMEVAWRIVNNS